MINTVLFDLDGTLVDTAIGLHHCLSEILLDANRPLVPLETIKHHINAGALGFIKLGFPDIDNDKKLITLKDALLVKYDYYLTHVPSDLFPGVLTLLQTLQRHDYQLGIVTNKYQRFTLPLLAQLDLKQYFKTIVCGDMVSKGKPEPDSLLLACHDLAISVSQSSYVGDSMVDVLAANNAKMPIYLAGWGYKADEVKEEVKNIKLIETPGNLLHHLK